MRTVPLLLLLLPALALAATTNRPAPPRVLSLFVPANNAVFYAAQHAGAAAPSSLNAVIALPEGFDPKQPWPLLLVTAPSGASAVQALRGYTNVALAEGWLVAAVDGPKVSVQKDDSVFAWAMISALVEHTRRLWPQSRTWPLACAGFSGGAKRAAMTAANLTRQHDPVLGGFMGGCNEDRATVGLYVARPGESFLDVPMFLSNGRNDPIAGLSSGLQVKQSMEQVGFRNVRLQSHAGGHQLDTNDLRAALQWFRPRPATPARQPVQP